MRAVSDLDEDPEMLYMENRLELVSIFLLYEYN